MSTAPVHAEKSYVLVTPARNEGPFVRALIDSVLAQTIRPTTWVIVSDASTDDTDEIVSEYSQSWPFIRLLRLVNQGQRSFGSKARAFQAGFDVAKLSGTYRFLGNLDADITLEPTYYERLIREMDLNPKLGIATGVCWDKTARGFKCVTMTANHAVGAVHFFRRQCFEAVGGYRPVSVGGMDSLAVLTARMKGWETHCFSDLPVYHHKPVDSAGGRKAVQIAFRAGSTEYHIGTHPLFAVAKAIRRWRSPPPMVGSVIRVAAYAYLWLRGVRRDATIELTSFVQREQMNRLKAFFRPSARSLAPGKSVSRSV